MKLWRGKKAPAKDDTAKPTAGNIPAVDSAGRYCRDDVTQFVAGKRQVLFYSRRKRTSLLVPSQLAALLERCDQFRTLEEHAREYLKSYQKDSARSHQDVLERVREQLSELVKIGLLIQESEVRAECIRLATPAQSIEIDFVGVITRNRINSLERCLASHIEMAKTFERTNPFLVMDDSEEHAHRSMTRRRLKALEKSCGVKIFYAGLEEKVNFAKALERESGLPHQVVNFALFDTENVGCSIGGNRNALLLATAGKTCLSVDDDTECRIAGPFSAQTRIVIEPRKDFLNVSSFQSREELMQAVSFVSADFLKIHEQMLGRSLRSLMTAHPDHSDTPQLDFANPQFLRPLAEGGKVLITFSGLAGDPGVNLPPTLQPLNEVSHETLLRSREQYEIACRSRELLKVPSAMILSRRGAFVTAAFGFDHRSLLPPFFPLFRGQDGTFGATLHKCFLQGYWGYVPWAILHSPSDDRSYSTETTRRILGSVRLCNIVTALINEFQFSPILVDDEQRLCALGDYLVGVGSMKMEDFEEFIRLSLFRAQTAYLRLMEKQLSLFSEQPDFWSDDVRGAMRSMEKSLLDWTYTIPQDVLVNRSADDARKLTQSLVLRFGELLHSWPAIVGASRNLRAQGIHLAQALDNASADLT